MRRYGLTIPGGLFDANGRQRVKCLLWDQKTNFFLKQCLERLGSLGMQSYQGVQGRDIEKPTSRKSRNMNKGETFETLKNQRIASESGVNTEKRDFRDIRDVFSEKKEKIELEDFGGGCSDTDENINESIWDQKRRCSNYDKRSWPGTSPQERLKLQKPSSCFRKQRTQSLAFQDGVR